MDSLFVKIGQEMRKWQPKSSKKRENRKSLAPPLKPIFHQFFQDILAQLNFRTVSNFAHLCCAKISTLKLALENAYAQNLSSF